MFATLPDVKQMRLFFEIAFSRYGWRLPVASVALAVCLVVWVFWVPVQAAKARRALDSLQQSQRADNQGNGVRARETSLRRFQRSLLPQAETNSQLRIIFQFALNAGLAVSQVDMRRQADSPGAFSQLQVSLPLRGDYPEIKSFCNDLLLELPGLSIDQLSLRREQVSGGPIDAQISLSLWQGLAQEAPK